MCYFASKILKSYLENPRQRSELTHSIDHEQDAIAGGNDPENCEIKIKGYMSLCFSTYTSAPDISSRVSRSFTEYYFFSFATTRSDLDEGRLDRSSNIVKKTLTNFAAAHYPSEKGIRAEHHSTDHRHSEQRPEARKTAHVGERHEQHDL